MNDLDPNYVSCVDHMFPKQCSLHGHVCSGQPFLLTDITRVKDFYLGEGRNFFDIVKNFSKFMF